MKFENIQTCFLGMAIGDALGVPVEFSDRALLRRSPVRDMIGFGTWNQPPGTWSDDSSLAFCLAESLIDGYDPEDIGRKFVAWYTDGYWGAHHKVFDVGGTTRVAIARIQQGHEACTAGETGEHANCNGSLMRIAPASIYCCYADDIVLFDTVREISAITHGHIRSVLSCFIFSRYLIALMKGVDKFDALTITSRSVESVSKARNISDAEQRLFDRILKNNLHQVDEDAISSSGYVLHTLEAALWCFLTTTSYPECVLKAVNLGGDTDTTGCVAGALAGMYYGSAGIPMQWEMTLARHHDIIKLAEDFTESLKKKILHEIPDHVSSLPGPTSAPH